MKEYHPTHVCLPVKEWEQMNQEIKELRIKSASYDTYMEKLGKVWFSKDKDALLEDMVIAALVKEQESYVADIRPFQMQNKHDGAAAATPEVEALKAAVDSGKTIEDGKGNYIFKEGHSYKFVGINGGKCEDFLWNAMQPIIAQSTGWQIKPEPPTDDYNVLMAYLGMGKLLKAEDGTSVRIIKKDGVLYSNEWRTVPWPKVVDQILKKHKNWKVWQP